MNFAKKQTFVFQDFSSFPGFGCTAIAETLELACDDLATKLAGVIQELRDLQNQSKATASN